MAKYDTYKLVLQVGTNQDQARLELSVIFEDGDNEQQVIQEVREKILVEALVMKDTQFLIKTKQ